MHDPETKVLDYSASLYLPATDFPMRGGLPQKEPEILAHWAKIDLYARLRESAKGREKFVLHDGPPYANGNIHIGHALNKILKDLVTRSQQMLGKDSNYVPGWDCHGLPIEWKIEEEYRAKGLNKDDVPVVEFRQQCRAFAQKWVDVQREEFKRLGITGDWAHPYLTMTYAAEAQIAREIMKFAANGLLYRGSKPVMWSVVEKTALAEAEVEYEEHTSDTVYVAFPVVKTGYEGVIKTGKDGEECVVSSDGESVVEAATTAGNYGVATDANAMLSNHQELRSSSVLIWTTTPWTIPGNRAISFSLGINYGLYRVTEAPEGNWVSMGRTLIIADKLANEVSKAAKVSLQKVRDLPDSEIWNMMVSHPLATHDPYYANLTIPLLEGDYVTDDTGTGFVHMAPGHGREDFDLWMANGQNLTARAIDTHIPFMIDADGFYTDEAPGFGPSSTEGKPGRVITDKGDKGDANERVIKALIAAGNLVARGRLKHQYPHSWRSKKPIIFRNTPQWFIAMDKAYRAGSGANEKSLRDVALNAITQTRWVPASGENRIHGMIANRPDWVMSRQRAWGVPIAIFANETGEILQDAAVNKAIADAFEVEGADAWFAPGAAARFLAGRADASQWHQVQDVLDVWFDSGSTHAYVLDDPKHFPALAEIHRKVDGGRDEVMYLEGSDQHRGWFHSSLLESCGTRGRAPFDVVLTHGFTLDEKGRKMSKSLGNTVVPQKIIEASGADILRLWVASVDYSDDQRIGPEILKSVSDNYRKLRNTIRWMLGTLAHYDGAEHIGGQGMEETERLMLHRLVELDAIVRAAFETFDYNKVLTSITSFITADLSAFYFDIRKDALYCDAPSSSKRQGALETIEHIFQCVVTWLAPILVFTCEEAWLSRYPTKLSVHLEAFPTLPTSWQDVALGDKWAAIRKVRSVVTGALEIERANKNIGSSLEAAPEVYIEDAALLALVKAVDMAEVCITSDIKIIAGQAPAGAFQLGEVPGVGVVVRKATGIKCARSWKYFDAATALPGFADVTPRDAEALQELKAMGKWPQ